MAATERYDRKLRPRFGVVITTCSHEEVREYTVELVDRIPKSTPIDEVELLVSPKLLEY